LNGIDGARFPRQTERSGGQKGRGLGGKEFLPALAFSPPPNFVPVKLARRHKHQESKFKITLSIIYIIAEKQKFNN